MKAVDDEKAKRIHRKEKVIKKQQMQNQGCKNNEETKQVEPSVTPQKELSQIQANGKSQQVIGNQ